MKYNCVIFVSLLVVGLCSGLATHHKRSAESPTESQSSVAKVKEIVDEKVENLNSLLNDVKEIRGFLGQKWDQLRGLFKGCKNAADVQRQAFSVVDSELPQFEDKIYVGDLVRDYKLAFINFTNVKVEGLSGFTKSALSVDLKTNTAKLVLTNVQDRIRITGDYSLSNKVKKASGPFIIDFSKGITYTETDGFAKYSNDEVDINKSEAVISYGHVKNDFKDLGFFTQIFRNEIGSKLSVKEVLPLVAQTIGYELRTYLLRKLRAKVGGRSEFPEIYGGSGPKPNPSGNKPQSPASHPAPETEKPENKFEEIVKGAVSEARVLLEKGGYSNLHLDGDSVDFSYNHLTGKLMGVNVSGLCTFELVSLATGTPNGKVRADLQIKTASLSGYAEVLVKDDAASQSQGGGVDGQTLNVGFNIDHVIVYLVFEKQLNSDNAWFELVRLDVSTQKLEPVVYASYTELQLGLIQNQLPRVLADLINERLAALAKGAIQNSIDDATKPQGLDERSNFREL